MNLVKMTEEEFTTRGMRAGMVFETGEPFILTDSKRFNHRTVSGVYDRHEYAEYLRSIEGRKTLPPYHFPVVTKGIDTVLLPGSTTHEIILILLYRAKFGKTPILKMKKHPRYYLWDPSYKFLLQGMGYYVPSEDPNAFTIGKKLLDTNSDQMDSDDEEIIRGYGLNIIE